VHAHLGVGLRRVPARRFICGTSALHSRHGGGAERLKISVKRMLHDDL